MHDSGWSIVFPKVTKQPYFKALKKPTYSKIVMADGGFSTTKFLEHFRPCIVILFIFIQDGKFVQRYWSDVKTGIILLSCRRIVRFCPFNITGLCTTA